MLNTQAALPGSLSVTLTRRGLSVKCLGAGAEILALGWPLTPPVVVKSSIVLAF